MQIKIVAPYEPLDIQIGEVVIRTSVPTAPNELDRISKECATVEKKLGELSKLGEKLDQKTKVPKDIQKKTADVLEEFITKCFGKETYDAIFEACGQRRKVKKEDCIFVMTRVVATVAEVASEFKKNALEVKAAQYLMEETNA